MTSFSAARQLLAVGGVGLALALAGCATAPTPAPSTTVAVAPTPTPTPEPTVIEEVPAAAVVVVAADLLEVRDQSGVAMLSLTYRLPTADAVAALTSVFGTPAQERFEAGNHNGEGTRYVWPGLTVQSEDRWASIPETELPDYLSRWWVIVDAPSVNGVAVQTPDGVRVGDATQSIIDRFPESIDETAPNSSSRTDLYLNPIPVDTSEYGVGDDFEPLWRVWLIDEEPQEVIEQMRAPSPNFGA